MKSEFEYLLIEYGNKMFDCGEWDGDSSAEYRRLSQQAAAAKDAVLQMYNCPMEIQE